MTADPEPGQKCRGANRCKHPFNAVAREILSFQDCDGVEYEDKKNAAEPNQPLHTVQQGTIYTSVRCVSRREAEAVPGKK